MITSEINQTYLTRFSFTDGFVLVLRDEAYLITDSRYSEAANKEAENCTVVARRDLILRYYAEVQPETKGWLTDDLPMWLWFSARQKITAIDCVTAVHRVLATSVSHSRQWQKQLDFCYSLDSIMLWFDENYNNNSLHRFLSRRRQNRALWLLSYNGSVAQYIKLWWQTCREYPYLFLNISPYGLFVKKVFWRMWL